MDEPRGLAAVLQRRMRELTGSRPGRTMTAADLQRRTGLPHATVYAYVRGDIQGSRLTDDVRTKLAAIATALEMPVDDLIAAAQHQAEPDEETELLRAFRRLTPVERAHALFVIKEFAAIRRRVRRNDHG